MAFRVQNNRHGRQNGVPVVATAGTYNNAPTFQIGPDNGNFKHALNAGVPKWENLFTTDPEGTPNLLNLIDWLEQNSEDFVRVRDEVERFISQYQAKYIA